MPNEIIEVAVNLAEPLLLFYLLKHKLAVKKRLLPAAIFGIAVLTAATTVMNKLEFGYVAVIIINLALFCINSAIFFTGDIRMKLVWASMKIYILVFANTFVMSGLYAVSSSLFMTALQPSALRITAQAAYILVSYLMVLIILKATKSLAMFSSKAAVGALFSCIICIVTMYLLLEVTIASAEAGISSVKHGIIAALLMTLVILVLVLFGKASIWAQKYAEERIVTDSLKREIQYDSEIKAVAQTVRQLKHDYSSHMSVIASYASEGDIDSLRKYMHDYKSEYGTIDRYAITG
ncbi:MAG: hypothetical protein IKX58_03650, partial [Clostridia bacterium]|nr:hypothetical protein [Clostridia bacterium]